MRSTMEPLPTPYLAGYLQFTVEAGAPARNLDKVRTGLAQLRPNAAGLVVLPELWATGFVYDRLASLAAETPPLLATGGLVFRGGEEGGDSQTGEGHRYRPRSDLLQKEVYPSDDHQVDDEYNENCLFKAVHGPILPAGSIFCHCTTRSCD